MNRTLSPYPSTSLLCPRRPPPGISAERNPPHVPTRRMVVTHKAHSARRSVLPGRAHLSALAAPSLWRETIELITSIQLTETSFALSRPSTPMNVVKLNGGADEPTISAATDLLNARSPSCSKSRGPERIARTSPRSECRVELLRHGCTVPNVVRKVVEHGPAQQWLGEVDKQKRVRLSRTRGPLVGWHLAHTHRARTRWRSCPSKHSHH